ncbi:MAG: TetR/AcrR family transcriptional regulator [Planctomycetaceae bacterium]|nr:TetR/AcrR family transcriptional regulator [Planctomycetaceae bacterium]
MSLIRAGGVPAVTLSAVCRVAGISKGGLVHHFPSKDALIEAFLDRAASQYLAWINSHMSQVPLGRGRWTLAWLELLFGESSASTSFDSGGADKNEENQLDDDQCTAVMLALIQLAGRGGNLRSLSEHLIGCLRKDGLSLDLATTLLVTMDGFWLQSVIEAPEELPARSVRLLRQLRKLVRTEVIGPQGNRAKQKDQKRK